MNPACDVSPDELIAYTEEDLPEGRMRQIEAHVPSCPACQERLAEGERIGDLLRTTVPEPPEYARHDLMVRLYQEAEGQEDRPHRDWGQVASLTALCGTFLLAAVLLWSGVDEITSVLRSPFQEAALDPSTEWVEDDAAEQALETAPMPGAIRNDFPLHDHWVRSGIRTLVYQDGESAETAVEISQFRVDDPEPPGYMSELDEVEGVPVYVDDPLKINEIRWTHAGFAHHAELLAGDGSPRDHLTPDDARAIVGAFLDQRR